MAEKIQLGNRDYQSLYNVLRAYRRAGGHSDTIADKFNRFDNPNTCYFRIFFDFHKGLIDCTHDLGKLEKPDYQSFWDKNTIIANSALNYLMINNEWERADMLRDFINLLSNINTNSPWYFSEIEGLGELLNRTEYTAESYMLPDIKTIGIKCLPDAYDNRIGTLIDLYRAICYSQQLHKEIIPANLRRFDMYIYIFPANKRGIHTVHKYKDGFNNVESKEPVMDGFATYDHDMLDIDDDGSVKLNGGQYLTSSKLIYLSGCEIDLNASVSGYNNIKNDEGFLQEYNIPIKVRVAMEQRYNEILMKRIGDYIVGDMDLPKSNANNPGNLREIPWKDTDANSATRTGSTNNRIQYDSLKTGMYIPDKDTPESYDDYKKQVESNGLGTNIYRDQNKTSLMDPWVNKGIQKAEQLAEQVNQIIGAGKSAIESWTDMNKLNQSLANGADSLVNRLIWGNIFETNLQDITSGISSFTAGLSSDNVVDNVTRKGWTHKSRKSPNPPTGNIFNT